MKQKTFWIWSLGLALTALPLASGGDQGSPSSAPVFTLKTNQPSGGGMAGMTNAPAPEAVAEQLENAAGQVVSAATPPPRNVNLTGPAAEVVKLAQAGVDENVMLSFVMNSPNTFNLSSEAIIYLNDIGVPGTVVTSMLQHDQALKPTSANSVLAPAPPGYTDQLVPAPGSATSYPTPGYTPETVESQPPGSSQPPEQANVTYTYFYDSLAPYGNWIAIDGYGYCWQPTVVVGNPGWRPYCNGGYWAYSDRGWYWASDYSWGWAPFHYGRWFCHHRWGWCWAPDTVWGPAWVSWRYTRDYCGWAPLPPTACFWPGIGFTYCGFPVGFDFTFGLSWGNYAFVGYQSFCDRHLHHHLVPEHEVRGFFDHSFVARGVLDNQRTYINAGIPVSRVAAATHQPIHRLHVRDADSPAGGPFDRVDPDGRSLTAYRPHLPTPTRPTALVGQSVRPDWHYGAVAPTGGNTTVRNEARPHISAGGAGTLPSANASSRLVQGLNRSASPLPDRPHLGTSQSTLTQPAMTTHPTARAQDSSRVPLNPDQRQFATPVFRAQSPTPVQIQPRQQNPPVYRQEAPKYVQQDRGYSQPAAPVQPQQAVRAYQWTPAANPGVQPHWVAPAPERSAPSFHPESGAPAPAHAEPRQAPAANNSSPAPSRGSGGNQNNRNNR